MANAGGRGYLAIPGPSVMPEEVLRAMHRAAPNIYEGELIDMTASILPDLCDVARTKGKVAIYIGNGHAAWEAALANVIAPGDRVLVPATGRFGHGWAEMAEGLGAEIDLLEFGQSGPFDAGRIEAALRADKDQKIKAVLALVQAMALSGFVALAHAQRTAELPDEVTSSSLISLEEEAALSLPQMARANRYLARQPLDQTLLNSALPSHMDNKHNRYAISQQCLQEGLQSARRPG